MIEVKNLYKRYGSHVAVNNLSFKIEDGEILGFLGPNGAGKTTTMNMITGYLSSTQGEIEIDGVSVLSDPMAAKTRIGYLPEQPPLYTDMTVKEYLNFVYDLKKVRMPRGPHLAEICRLVRVEEVYNRLIKNLSKGYRQRVGIAQALVGNPDVLILDEPTVGLDPKQIIEIRNLIAHLGKTHTVILSSHILSEIQAVCERVIIINRGTMIADDSPDNLAKHLTTDHSFVARILGPKAEVTRLLKGIKGVKTAVCLGPREQGAFEYKIDPVDRTDIRKELFKRLADRSWPLIMLKSNEPSLEEIFIKLTDLDEDEMEQIRESFKNPPPEQDIKDEFDMFVEPDEQKENEEESQELLKAREERMRKTDAIKLVDGTLGFDDEDEDEEEDK